MVEDRRPGRRHITQHPGQRSWLCCPSSNSPPPHRLPKLSNLRCYYSFQCSQCLFNLKFIHDCCCRQPSIPPILKMLKKEDLWIFETAMTSPSTSLSIIVFVPVSVFVIVLVFVLYLYKVCLYLYLYLYLFLCMHMHLYLYLWSRWDCRDLSHLHPWAVKCRHCWRQRHVFDSMVHCMLH